MVEFAEQACLWEMVMPMVVAGLWIVVGVVAYNKNGDYGAPWHLQNQHKEQEIKRFE